MDDVLKVQDRVREFVQKQKAAFKEKIERNKIDNIGVSSLEQIAGSENAYEAIGSVATVSPTGKLKTFKYIAKVTVDGKSCTLDELKVIPLD